MNTSPLENNPDVPNDDPNNRESLPEFGVRIPDGGLQAWLIVLGGFINYFVVFGTGASTSLTRSVLLNGLGIMNSWATFQTLYGLPPGPWPTADAGAIGFIGHTQVDY